MVTEVILETLYLYAPTVSRTLVERPKYAAVRHHVFGQVSVKDSIGYSFNAPFIIIHD